MRKYKNKNAMMIAYIIFLIICMLYHLFADEFNLEFDSWNKIVCATTISSCLFAIANSKKSQYNISTKVKRYLIYSNNDLEKIKDKRLKNPEKYKNSKYEISFLAELIEDNKKHIEKIEKLTVSTLRQSFIFNVIGFLMFFCLIVFDFVYNFFGQMEGFYTVLAFVVILLTDVYEEKWAYNYEELLEKSFDLYDTEEQTNE